MVAWLLLLSILFASLIQSAAAQSENINAESLPPGGIITQSKDKTSKEKDSLGVPLMLLFSGAVITGGSLRWYVKRRREIEEEKNDLAEYSRSTSSYGNSETGKLEISPLTEEMEKLNKLHKEEVMNLNAEGERINDILSRCESKLINPFIYSTPISEEAGRIEEVYKEKLTHLQTKKEKDLESLSRCETKLIYLIGKYPSQKGLFVSFRNHYHKYQHHKAIGEAPYYYRSRISYGSIDILEKNTSGSEKRREMTALFKVLAVNVITVHEQETAACKEEYRTNLSHSTVTIKGIPEKYRTAMFRKAIASLDTENPSAKKEQLHMLFQSLIEENASSNAKQTEDKEKAQEVRKEDIIRTTQVPHIEILLPQTDYKVRKEKAKAMASEDYYESILSTSPNISGKTLWKVYFVLLVSFVSSFVFLHLMLGDRLGGGNEILSVLITALIACVFEAAGVISLDIFLSTLPLRAGIFLSTNLSRLGSAMMFAALVLTIWGRIQTGVDMFSPLPGTTGVIQ